MAKPEPNPVVLLSDGVWHIVESSRASAVCLCGRPIGERRAHSRLRTIGADHVCPRCLAAHQQQLSAGL